MEALGIDIKLILVQVANFAILLFLLNRFLYKPILKMLEKRREVAEEALALKNSLEKKVSDVEKEREQILVKTRKEAETLLDEARQKGDRLVMQIEASTKEKTDILLEKAKMEAEAKEPALREELKNEVARVAVMVSEQVLGTELDSKNKETVTKEAIRRFVGNAE